MGKQDDRESRDMSISCMNRSVTRYTHEANPSKEEDMRMEFLDDDDVLCMYHSRGPNGVPLIYTGL